MTIKSSFLLSNELAYFSTAILYPPHNPKVEVTTIYSVFSESFSLKDVIGKFTNDYISE